MSKAYTPPFAEMEAPKLYPKAKDNFSIRADVKADFAKHTRENKLNKSGLVESWIIAFLAYEGNVKYQKELEKK